MIGSSTGVQYQSELEAYLGSTMPLEGSRMPADASKSNLGTEIHVDREHDVPLAASALHKDGQMYGIAIDKDAPIMKKYDQYIYKHEADEFGYMQDLIKTGMEPHEAYQKAHDHITPMESARVQADLGEKGLEDYKQYWRGVASAAASKEVLHRHPDAHTTTYGLDEKELGKKYAMAQTPGQRAKNIDIPGAGVPDTAGGGAVPEFIPPESAAIKLRIGPGKGKIFTGGTHSGATLKAIEEGALPEDFNLNHLDDGFVTSKGRFVNRTEAGTIAKEAEQVKAHHLFRGQLMSESLDPEVQEMVK